MQNDLFSGQLFKISTSYKNIKELYYGKFGYYNDTTTDKSVIGFISNINYEKLYYELCTLTPIVPINVGYYEVLKLYMTHFEQSTLLHHAQKKAPKDKIILLSIPILCDS